MWQRHASGGLRHHARTGYACSALRLRCRSASAAVQFGALLRGTHARCHASCLSTHAHLSSLTFTAMQERAREHGQSLCPVLTQRTRRRARVLGARGHRQDLAQAWQWLLQWARAAATAKELGDFGARSDTKTKKMQGHLGKRGSVFCPLVVCAGLARATFWGRFPAPFCRVCCPGEHKCGL